MKARHNGECRPGEPIEGRKKLETVVTKVGRSLDELVKTIETTAPELKSTDLERTFRFLVGVFDSAQKRAELGFKIGQAANGGFSLDAEPETPLEGSNSEYVIKWPNPSTAPRPERIVGQKKRTPPPDDDDVDFIDE